MEAFVPAELRAPVITTMTVRRIFVGWVKVFFVPECLGIRIFRKILNAH